MFDIYDVVYLTSYNDYKYVKSSTYLKTYFQKKCIIANYLFRAKNNTLVLIKFETPPSRFVKFVIKCSTIPDDTPVAHAAKHSS